MKHFLKDTTKSFAYLEDNGDETCTMTMNIPSLELFQTILIETPLVELVGLAEHIADHARDNLMEKMVTIPDDAESL